MSFRARLLVLVLAVWLPAAAGFGLFAERTYEKEIRQAQQQVEQLGQTINSVVERELDRRAVLARTLASLDAVAQGDIERFHHEAARAVQGGSDWVVLVNATHHLAHTLTPYSAQPVPRAIQAPLAGAQPEVIFVPSGSVTRKALICVFTGVPGRAAQQVNVGVAFEAGAMQLLLSRFSLPLGGVIAVIDDRQRVMARSRDPDKWLGMSATGDVKRRAEGLDSGFAESVTLDGVPSLTYLSPPNQYGWAVVIGMPQSAIAATAVRLTTQALTAAAVLLLIGLALALAVAQGLGSAVLALRRAAAELGEGGVPGKLKTGNREVDEVAVALHDAGTKVQRASLDLALQVRQAVEQAEQAQVKLLNGQRHEAIGRLTGGIAHDFNNLLQTISISHHLLNRQLPDGPHRKVLQSAGRATAKAADLVKQLLTFGRVQKLDPRPVDMGDLILNSQELTSKAVGERVVMTALIEPHLPPLFVDPMQLELALLNLVFNARDAIPDSGHITIEGRLATADESRGLGAGPYIRLSVSDDGAGMSDEIAARVFEPYFTTKPVGAGSGLGLAQVEAFARQSGGDIGVTSRLGQGTTITLTLPAAAEGAVDTPMPPGGTVPGEPLRVLMVEDDVLVSSVVVSALEAEGHAVTLCRTGDEALGVLQGRDDFDVLFTDVVMAGSMSGTDLIRWCREHRPGLPAVAATGYAEGLTEMTVQVLRKPYGIDVLLQALQQSQPVPARHTPAEPII